MAISTPSPLTGNTYVQGGRGGHPSNTGTMAALGISDQEAKKREDQYGVNAGSQGYVSGQAPPAAPAAATSTPFPQTTPGGNGWGNLGSPPPNGGVRPVAGTPTPPPGGSPTPPPGGQPTPPPGRNGVPIAYAGAGGAPAPIGIGYAGQGTPGGGPGGVQTPNAGASVGSTGTNTQGYNIAGPAGGAALGQVPVLGEMFSTATTDLSPTKQAQAAAMGEAANLDSERYNYRPGAAPAQDVVQLDTAQADQTRQRQQAALDAITAAANGTVPSAAEIQMREAAARSQAANLGAARALGGRSAGGAARAATVANAEAGSELNAQAAAQRAAEQATARQQQIAALSGVRGQDIDTSQSNANLRQQAYGNNLTSQTQQNQLAEEHRKALLAAQLQALGIGTTAAGQTVNAASKNTDAINKSKGGYMDMLSAAIGV